MEEAQAHHVVLFCKIVKARVLQRAEMGAAGERRRRRLGRLIVSHFFLLSSLANPHDELVARWPCETHRDGSLPIARRAHDGTTRLIET